MGALEDAVDAAAHFIGPFLGKGSEPRVGEGDGAAQLIERALSHLQKINTAEKAAEPNAPYDGSLVGVVYGLLDLITSLGVLPYLSSGVVFSQRPQSVLIATISIPPLNDQGVLSTVVDVLVPILEQKGTGVQPLLSQRVLPDIVSALAELSFSPRTSNETHQTYTPLYNRVIASTPTSRLLPVLTSLLQQDLPLWWKPRLSNELTLIPLRHHGVRHIIDFLALSYLSKNSQVPQDAAGPQTQIPLPLEAITQASRLLAAVPSGMLQDDWFTQIAPELLTLLDGSDGKELSRAAGQIISSGILSKKSTGAPKTIGWELFARPLQEAISPKNTRETEARHSTSDQVLVSENNLLLALRRLATIASSYSHAGLIKRLIGPVLLPLWGLINYTSSRPALNKEWTELPRVIVLRYLALACEPSRIDNLSNNLFWDGDTSWTFGPGSQAGVEIRRRAQGSSDVSGMEGMLSRIGKVDERIGMLVSLLVDANIEDQVAGVIFIQTSRRWLSPSQEESKPSLTHELDGDPLAALINAKLSEALASKFRDKFARSPQHVIELIGQLLQNFVDEHKTKVMKRENANKPTRANLSNLVQPLSNTNTSGDGNESDDIASFALSVLNTLITSSTFKQTPESIKSFSPILPSLQYLVQPHIAFPIPSLIANAATNVIQTIQPPPGSSSPPDPQAAHRTTLKTALIDLTSPEPPNRTWALSALRKLIQNPTAFPVIDVPSLTHALLSASVADPESYVYTAAIPVLVGLAVKAPNPTLRIIVDAFIDIDERSLRLKKEKEIEEALDYRLRVGEIINNLILEDLFWNPSATASTKFSGLKAIVEACLSIASRRGQRKKTLAKRSLLLEAERKQQEEGEVAWGGPIPNLLDPNAENAAEQEERNALLKIVQGWENTGIEEDVRIRTSALSILGSVLEKRLELLSQVAVDAGLQMILLILTVETGETKGILRRAAVLVVMGLLRGMDGLLEDGKESAAGLDMQQIEEVERVLKWVGLEDGDGLVKDHAQSVIEGLETWRMKKVYRIRDEGLRLGPDLGLEGNLRGLDVRPLQGDDKTVGRRGPIVEEIE